ncbi:MULTISPECIES: ATP-dependent Clp protease adapter ClpS [Alcaligenes]|uniref:ATP-dependent Clp protease adapter ClpS n=1 Tax=Alcaligenes TaxID=507 RepID=UPI0002AA95B3|nr:MULTISPECIES: ATP-dependent Clp protease adapter ClpS [Alcaligenes]EKU31075.1 ATP-dependent Clp protease adaptor protein ClpS [Alcaligenes sp. HPC1271]ERI34837.1 ATP-dependent Clp protease ClpS [Alcaligenes sp. EGD-AK7]HRO20614.1 ATP-dependent Clp protease adapter ClpS [Alcaligenes phenolicus]HRP13446.1 ATP-dependent Clp protease adapter ClpS [Alcaligenes phenolicus]
MAIEIDKQGATTVERQSARLAPPPMYQVILLNDDYTPMEFVVNILERVFAKTPEQAEQLMLKVHYEGRAVCGVYPRDIAATKVEIVRQLAQSQQHPLQCVMEPVPDA